jgi:Antibiotic biosynthesis monooxygenase
MYMAVRKYQTSSGAAEEALRRVEEGFVPIISQAPGFVAYYGVNAGNDIVFSVSVFRDQAAADESNRMAANWVKQNLVPLLPNPPEISAGEVKFYKAK